VAKGGGGSWKVAYADFVTAMMAFFLVMWIGAQDVKVRQSVANYFVDPSGVSKTPKSGGVMMEVSPGQVPKHSDPGTQGTRSPGGDVPSPSTAAVMRWVSGDAKRMQYWKDQAQRCRESIAAQQKAANQNKTPEELLKKELSMRLSAEIAEGIPKDAPAVYKDLIFASTKEVNWEQVADYILST
jgi:flagellar motor protein MotB